MQLKEFVDRYGGQIATTISTQMEPIFDPIVPSGVEEFVPRLERLLRPPFPVQAEIIKGVAKALYSAKREHNFIVGEMGTGKTCIALSVIALSPRPIRSLVVSPTHLVEKWKREAAITVPDVRVVDLSDRDAISVLGALRAERQRPGVHEVFVISKERAKLSHGWRAAAVMTRRSSVPKCPDCGSPTQGDDGAYILMGALEKRRRSCKSCGSRLWQAAPQPRRFAPAEFIKKYLKGFFDLVVLDEIQDFKAGDSLQGNSMGSLLAASRKCLCLTGTLNGGYADDLFYLLFRMDPARLVADGFGYKNVQGWMEAYGVLESIREIEEKDFAYGRSKKKGQTIRRRPGVSPLVVGRYLLDKAAFVRLADMVDGLPPYEESVVSVKMDTEQKLQYALLQDQLKSAVKEHGNRALASMLQGLLSYPDSAPLFGESIGIRDRAGQFVMTIEAPRLDPSRDYPKEEALLKIVRGEKEAGRKVLCYVTFTNTRDIRPRIVSFLEREGVRVGVLDASVPPKRREAWIAKHTEFDVLVVNAELVKTGLDLLNYPTVVFYQTGYNIFTLRQAARRSWRIGQTEPVKVFYLCYQGTMQAAAIDLVAKKLEAAVLVEGDLPKGLAEYVSSGGSMIEEMGKALMEGGDYSGAEAAWARFRKTEIENVLGLKDSPLVEERREIVQRRAADASGSGNPDAVVRVTLIEGPKRRQSTVEVKVSDLGNLGKPAQLAMF